MTTIKVHDKQFETYLSVQKIDEQIKRDNFKLSNKETEHFI